MQALERLTYIDILKMFISISDESNITEENEIRNATQADIENFLK